MKATAHDQEEQRLLFVTLSNIGDLVLTTPALLATHAAWPHARIDIVADRRSSELLRHAPFIGDLFHRDKDSGLAGFLALLRQLRERRYEAVIDLRTDFLPFLVRARRRTRRWHNRPHAAHAVLQHFAVARQILPAGALVPEARVWTSDFAHREALRQLAAFPGRRLVLAPGANWQGKCWPLPHYVELARTAGADFDSLVVLGSEADRPAADTIAAAVGQPVMNLAGRTNLSEVVALLPHCQAFVGNDSGLGHLAAASGVPTLTVFGPGDPARYEPWGPRAAIVLAPQANLKLLDPGVVARALRQHLAALEGVA